MNGYRYNVRVSGEGRFTVEVLREPPPDSIGYRRYVILRVSDITNQQAAEVIAATFRAQFGVEETRPTGQPTLRRASDHNAT